MGRGYGVKTFISKYLFLRRPGVANIADITKIAAMLIKITFKDSVKVKTIRKNVLKCNFYLYFLIQQKDANFWCKNININRTQAVCLVIFIRFGSTVK